MQPYRRDRLRHRLGGGRGWLIPAALLTLAPKCVLCVLAYAGLGAAFGLGGPELCGATQSPSADWIVWGLLLAGVAGAVRKLKAHP